MKKLLVSLLVLSSVSAFATCDAEKLVLTQTKKAMKVFADVIPQAAEVTNIKIALIDDGNTDILTYSMAALSKTGQVLALGNAKVDEARCEITTLPNGSSSNIFSFLVLSY